MNSKPQFLWYNFRTGQYDARDEPPDGDEWRDYISQIPAAQSMFGIYVEMGDTPIDAAIKVLPATIAPQEKTTP